DVTIRPCRSWTTALMGTTAMDDLKMANGCCASAARSNCSSDAANSVARNTFRTNTPFKAGSDNRPWPRLSSLRVRRKESSIVVSFAQNCSKSRAGAERVLEQDLGGELDEPRIGSLLNLTELRAGNVPVHRARAVELRVVEHVERLQAQLQGLGA